MNINLKKKLLLIIGISSLFVVMMDVLFGNFMFDKITDYWKIKSLSNLTFIFNNGTDISQKRLDEYQRYNNAQVIVVRNNNILNLYDYCFGEIETDGGEKITILLGSLLESNRRFELSKFEAGERIEIEGIEIFKNYYVPLRLEINNGRYSDDKLKIFFRNREKKISTEKTVSGKLMNLNYFHDHTKLDDSENLYLQSKFLQVLSAEKFEFNEIFIFDKSRIQILRFQREELTIFVFYQYENLAYVQALISAYNLYKIVFAFLMFIITIIALKIMIVDPISGVSESIKKIARGEKISLPQKHSDDEIGELFKSVEKLNEELYEVIQMYRESTERNNNIFVKIMEQTRVYMHEVRNPLSLILGYSTIAIEDLENRELEEVKESLEIIENAAKTLAILTKRDFSSEHKAMDEKLILSEFPIVNLIELVIKIIKIGGGKDIDVEFVNLTSEQRGVRADKERIKQVLWNILNNAIYFAEKKVRIELHDEGEQVKISIKNDGERIPDDHMDKIWDRYVTKSEKGEGIGLYIISRFLNEHNSCFGVNNLQEENFNVEFYFYLKKV